MRKLPRRQTYGLTDAEFLKGGQGSGNFGHAGRPGERGGSAAEGGRAISEVRHAGIERAINLHKPALESLLREIDIKRQEVRTLSGDKDAAIQQVRDVLAQQQNFHDGLIESLETSSHVGPTRESGKALQTLREEREEISELALHRDMEDELERLNTSAHESWYEYRRGMDSLARGKQ